jgi:hypothetical protein
VVEQRADERKGKDTKWGGVEDVEGVVIHGRPKTNECDIYNMNQEENKDRQAGYPMK